MTNRSASDHGARDTSPHWARPALAAGLMVAMLLSPAFPCQAQDPMNGPWEAPQHHHKSPTQADAGADTDVGETNVLIWFHRHVTDRVSAGSCPMYPSCSEYSRQCFEKYGPVRGWIMTCDRLMRCGRDELDRAPRIRVNGRTLCFDPVP